MYAYFKFKEHAVQNFVSTQVYLSISLYPLLLECCDWAPFAQNSVLQTFICAVILFVSILQESDTDGIPSGVL